MPGNYFAALPVRVPDGFLDSLKRAAPDALRWFHPEDLHLTLAFFGREDPERIPACRGEAGRRRALLEVLKHIPFPPLTQCGAGLQPANLPSSGEAAESQCGAGFKPADPSPSGEAADSIRAPLGPFVLLPNPRRFSALSFDLAESPAHNAITGLIAEYRPKLCEAAGIDPDTRPPYPHLTVARPDKKHPHFRPRLIAKWARALELPSDLAAIDVLPPALYTWHSERPVRQFLRIDP